jgi:hypothetical protein
MRDGAYVSPETHSFAGNMRAQHRLSPHDALGRARAIGRLALAGGVQSVRVYAAQRLTLHAPALEARITPSAASQEGVEGFERMVFQTWI